MAFLQHGMLPGLPVEEVAPALRTVHRGRCSFLEIYKDRHRERMVGTDGHSGAILMIPFSAVLWYFS